MIKQKAKKKNSGKQKFPPGWNEAKVRRVIAHYENQTEEEAVAEDEAAYHTQGQTMMSVPTDLVREVHKLIARRSKVRDGRGT
jgi:ribosomal protein L13E